MNFDINYLALFLSGFFSLLWGMAYYGPLLGEAWMKLAKVPNKKPKKEEMIRSMTFGFISYMVTAFFLSYFINNLGLITWQEGAKLGFITWAGFIATGSLGSVLWEKAPIKLYLLNNGWSLINLVAISIIMTLIG